MAYFGGCRWPAVVAYVRPHTYAAEGHDLVPVVAVDVDGWESSVPVHLPADRISPRES